MTTLCDYSYLPPSLAPNASSLVIFLLVLSIHIIIIYKLCTYVQLWLVGTSCKLTTTSHQLAGSSCSHGWWDFVIKTTSHDCSCSQKGLWLQPDWTFKDYSSLHWPLTINPSSPSPLGSVPASRVITLTTTPFLRPSFPSMTGGSSPRSSNTESWTKRLLHYRQSLTWWTWTLQHLSLPRRPARTILSPCKWQRRLGQWGSSISNCR